MSPPIELIFGAFTMNTYTPEIREEFLKLLEEYDVKAIDTAYSYVSVTHTYLLLKSQTYEYKLTRLAGRFRENPRRTRRSREIHHSYKGAWVPAGEIEEGESPRGDGEVVAGFEG